MLQKKYKYIEIIKYLLQADTFITAKQLSSLTNKSERTVKREIAAIKLFLPELGATIISKRNRGYKIVVTDTDKIEKYKLEIQITSRHMGAIDDAIVDDKKRILFTLLSTEKYLTIDDIAEELFISRNNLVNKLQLVKADLLSFHLNIKSKRKKGIKIIGDEIHKRILLLELLNPNYHFKKKDNYPSFFQNLFYDSNYQYYRDTIFNVLHQYNIHVYQHNIDKIINYFILSKNRIFQNNTITLPDSRKQSITQYTDYSAICDTLERFDISWPIDEKAAFALIILESRNIESTDFADEVIKNKSFILYNEFSKLVQAFYGVNLNNFEFLQENLSNVLIPIILKNDFGIAVSTKYSKNMGGTSIIKDPLSTDFAKTLYLFLKDSYQYAIDIDDFAKIINTFSSFFDTYQYQYKKIKINISTRLPRSVIKTITEKYIKKYDNLIDQCTYYLIHELQYERPKMDIFLTDSYSIPNARVDVPIIFFDFSPNSNFSFHSAINQAILHGCQIEELIDKFSRITHTFKNFPSIGINEIIKSLAIKYSPYDINEILSFFNNRNILNLLDGILYFIIPYHATNNEFIDIYQLNNLVKYKNKQENFENNISYIIVTSLNLTAEETKAIHVIFRALNNSMEATQSLFHSESLNKIYRQILFDDLLIHFI